MRIENPSDLWVLIHTARTGSLTAASGALGVTPAAASATLKRIESKLGVRLFERSTRAMRLTPEGQRMLDYATRAFELIAEGEAQVLADRAELVGTIRVAAPSDLARATLLPWVDEFLELHPEVQVALSVGDRTLDLVRDEVDLALRYGELKDSRVVARTLLVSQPIVTATPAYLSRHGVPKTPEDLQHHNCLAFERGGRMHRVWRFAKNGEWTSVRVHGDRSADDASLARQWALAGRGILLKTPIEQAEDLATGALVRILKGWETEPYPLYSVLPSARFVPQRVRAFADFLADKFGTMSATLRSLGLAKTGRGRGA